MRTRSGGILRDVAPANAYPTADGHDVVIAGNADAVFARLAHGDGNDPTSRPTTRRTKRVPPHQHELDEEIARWTSTMPAAELLALLQAHEVPVGLDQPRARPPRRTRTSRRAT